MKRQDFTLDDLYQEILDNSKKFNVSLILFNLCNISISLTMINPLFSEMIIPTNIFGIKMIYHLYKPLSLYQNECAHSKEYLELENNYFILLKELQQLLLNMQSKKPMEIFAIYYYLVLNGFLSVDKTFYANNSDFHYHKPTSIVAGHGVCRHLAPFFTDLLKCFEYDAFNIEMLLDNQAIVRMSNDSFCYTETLKNEIDNESFENKQSFLDDLMRRLIIKKSGNHISTLLADENKSYIIDPTNNTIYLIKSGCAYPLLNANEPIPIKSKVDFIERKVKLPKVDSLGIDNLDMMLNEYIEARKKCDDYSDTFEKFYLEHKDLYQEIIENRNNFEQKYQKIKSKIFIK